MRRSAGRRSLTFRVLEEEGEEGRRKRVVREETETKQYVHKYSKSKLKYRSSIGVRIRNIRNQGCDIHGYKKFRQNTDERNFF